MTELTELEQLVAHLPPEPPPRPYSGPATTDCRRLLSRFASSNVEEIAQMQASFEAAEKEKARLRALEPGSARALTAGWVKWCASNRLRHHLNVNRLVHFPDLLARLAE